MRKSHRTFVGAGDGPCVILGAGNRGDDDETFWHVYRRSELALRYGASVETDTTSGAEANAPFRDYWYVANVGTSFPGASSRA